MTFSDKLKAQGAKNLLLKQDDKCFHYAKLHAQMNHQTGLLCLLPTAYEIEVKN